MPMSALPSLRRLHRLYLSSAGAVLLAAAAGISPLNAAEHTLMPSPQTVHIGHFLATLKPVLTIDSGDIVTLEAAAQLVPDVIDKSGVVPPSAVPQYQRDIYGDVKDRGPGPHVLTGPIAIKGAEPGDVLEVRILDVSLAVDWGYNRQRPYHGRAARGIHRESGQRIIPIDRQNKTAEVAKGVVVPVDRPFFGTMGVAPPADHGTHQQRSARRAHRQHGQQGPDRRHHAVHAGSCAGRDVLGGRRACRAGSRRSRSHRDRDRNARTLPVHRAQGHEAHLAARRNARRTGSSWGCTRTSKKRMKIAVRETIDFITKRFPHLTREEAYMIASVAVDYHVTQVVDGTKGIHGMIPKSIFTAAAK